MRRQLPQQLERQRAVSPPLQTNVPSTSTTTSRECSGQGLQVGGLCPLPSARTNCRQSQNHFPARAIPCSSSALFREEGVFGGVGLVAHTPSIGNCQSMSRNGGLGLRAGIDRDEQKTYLGGGSAISDREGAEEEEELGSVSRSHVHSPGTRTDDCRIPCSGRSPRNGVGQSRCDSESSATSSLASEWHYPNDFSFLSIAMYQNSGTESPPSSQMSAPLSDRHRHRKITSPQSPVHTSQGTLTPKSSQRSPRYQPTSTSSQSGSFSRNSPSTAVAPLELSRRPSLGVVATRGGRLQVTGDCAAQLQGEGATVEPGVPRKSGVYVHGGSVQSEGAGLSNVAKLADRAEQTQSNRSDCAGHIVAMTGARRPGTGDDAGRLKKEGEFRSRGARGVFKETVGGSGPVNAPLVQTSRVVSRLRHRRFRGDRREGTAALITDEAAAASPRESGGPQSRRPVISWCSRARVCAMASAPSGELFTGGDPSGAIEVWDSRIGRRLGALRGHVAAVLSLKVLPHSTLLFSGSADRTAQLWDVRTLQSMIVLKGHRGLITSLATLHMTNVGLHLFTGSDDGTVRQWQALTGACVHVYQGHRGPVNVVTSLLPDKYIATGGCDGLFKVWNAQTLRCLSSVPAVPSRVSSGGLVGDESRARRQGVKLGGAYRCDDGVGESTATSGNGCVWDIAQLSDSNQSLATATDDGVVRLWATQRNRHAVLLKEICIPDMLLKACSGARCLLACGSYLFVGGAHGELYMWYTAELPHVDSDTRRGVETSCSRIWGGGLEPRTAPSDVVPPASTEKVETYRAAFLFHTAALTGLERQGTQLYSASLDHTVCRWDLRSLVALNDDALDATARVRTGAGCIGERYGALDSAAEGRVPFVERQISGGPLSARFMTNGDVVDAMSSSYSGASLSRADMLLQESRSVGGATGDAGGIGLYTGAAGTQWNGVGCADTVTNLNAAETAAVYAQLPLSFVVRQFRAAATSPVEIRSLLRTALLLVYTIFLLLFFGLGLAPVFQHSVDIAVGVFSLTANHPFPSFARPQTFRSIRNSEDLSRWLILLMEQLHSFQVPVHLSVTRNPNVSSVDDTAPLRHPRRSRGKGAVAIFQDTATCISSEHQIDGMNESIPKRFTGASDSFPPSSSCSPSASVGPRKGYTGALEDIVGVPAMPGGVVLLSNVRVRVKHVTNTSCTWNRHLLHRRLASTTPTADTTGVGATPLYACYGRLDRSTTATDPLCVAGKVSASIDGESARTGASSTAPQQCLPYMSEGAGVSFHGLAGVYDSGGYAVDLAVGLPHPDGPWVSEDLEALLGYQSRFIDGLRTRLVDVLLYTYHIHSQTFLQLHYSLEMPVAGVWLPATVARPFFVYGADDAPSASASATLACVVVDFSLLMCLLALVLYNIMLAYRMRELIAYLMSATILLNLILIVSGMCVVSFMLRWISSSAELKVAQLLQRRANIRNEGISSATWSDSSSSLSAPPEMSAVLSRLSDVEAAFRALSTSTAVHAIFLFQEITMVSWRLINFLQVMRVVMQQIRLSLLVGLVLMALSLTGISLTVHSVYGSTHITYGSVSQVFTHLLLYLGLCQTLNDQVSSPLLEDHRIIGRLLILWVNFVLRLFFYAYVVVQVWERFQAVASSIPAIPARARLAKWWLDIRFQFTLMQQSPAPTATSHLFFSSSAMSTVSLSSQQQQRRRDATPSREAAGSTARIIGDGRADHPPVQPPTMAVSEAANTMTSCVFLFGRGRHASLVEYLWKHLKTLQKHHERTRPLCTGGQLVGESLARGCLGSQRGSFAPWRSSCQHGQGSDPPASGDLSSAANPLSINREGGQGGFSFTDNRSGGRGYKDAAASVPGGASSVSTAGSDSGSDDGAACFEENPQQLSHPQVRQTDLLLFLPEEARTAFARSVIQHTWSSLTWMYHYDQQHARMHDDATRDQRRRLDQGILRTQDELASLYEIVRAAQARMADHEARLRPLAKAVAAVSRR